MEIHEIQSHLKEYASALRINMRPMFSNDELKFLFENSVCSVFEFIQEPDTESDTVFYHHFISWLQEEVHEGYIYYYLLVGMKKGEELSDDEFYYLEENITSSFERGVGWLAVTNRERRFKRRLTLIMFDKRTPFRRLIRK